MAFGKKLFTAGSFSLFIGVGCLYVSSEINNCFHLRSNDKNISFLLPSIRHFLFTELIELLFPLPALQNYTETTE